MLSVLDTAWWEESVTESLEASATESVSDTELLEASATESVSDTALLEVSDTASLVELGSEWEESTTATLATTAPPSSTLLSSVRNLVANGGFC